MLLPAENMRQHPWATLLLISLNLFVWFFSNHLVQQQQKQLETIQQQMSQIEVRYILQHPEFLDIPDYETKYRKILDGELIPKESKDYSVWQHLYLSLETLTHHNFFTQWGFVPVERNFLKIFTSLFLHVGLLHLFFNMLFLWIAGSRIEQIRGRKTLLAMYLLSGYCANLAHLIVYPDSTIPVIGASGAVAGIMGLFLVQPFKYRTPFIKKVRIPAYVYLLLWLLSQLAFAVFSSQRQAAHWVHFSGFIFGVFLGLLQEKKDGHKKRLESSMDRRPDFSPGEMELFWQRSSDDRLEEIRPHIPKLRQYLKKHPTDVRAAIFLTRACSLQGALTDAADACNLALTSLLETKRIGDILILYKELRDQSLFQLLPDSTLYRLAIFMEIEGYYYLEAAKLHMLYIQHFPKGDLRAKSICQLCKISKQHLNNTAIYQKTLALLNRDYPNDYPGLGSMDL